MQKNVYKAKQKLDSFDQQQGEALSASLKTAGALHSTTSKRIAWPPKLQSINILGEIQDTNGRNIPRDLGRSISLSNSLFYMFADTFCFDDAHNFCGLTSNTCAHIGDPSQPTKCSYWMPEPLVPEFIPLTPEDEAYNRRKRKEGTRCRVANWAFGGVVEFPPGGGKAWLLNDKTLILDGDSVGMELVKVELLKEPTRLFAEKLPGAFPFGAGEPRFGSINIFVDGEWVYLLGGHKDESGWPRNVLARLRYGDDPSQKGNYQFHRQTGGWRDDYARADDLTDVCSGQGHGMMFNVGDKCSKGKPYMWIGVDKWLSSKLWLGLAEKPEGPWDLHDVGEVPKFLGEKSKTRYCLYFHEWGSDICRGEFLISWSDDGQMGGLVVAGRMCLVMEYDS